MYVPTSPVIWHRIFLAFLIHSLCPMKRRSWTNRSQFFRTQQLSHRRKYVSACLFQDKRQLAGVNVIHTTLSTHARTFHVSREQRVNISEIVLFHKLRGEKATIIPTAVIPNLPRLAIMFLVCKYQEYKRQQQEVNKRKVTERELTHLNHKIDKLLQRLEEHELEPAATPDEECVVCINAKATMQTFPCGHRVVCRKCFVKTIQMAVSQRLLPLRCVICRAKILRLKQTTTGGISTGSVLRCRPHSVSPVKGSCPPSSLSSLATTTTTSQLPLTRKKNPLPPVSLLATTSVKNTTIAVSRRSCPGAISLSPVSPVTEVFQDQRDVWVKHRKDIKDDSNFCSSRLSSPLSTLCNSITTKAGNEERASSQPKLLSIPFSSRNHKRLPSRDGDSKTERAPLSNNMIRHDVFSLKKEEKVGPKAYKGTKLIVTDVNHPSQGRGKIGRREVDDDGERTPARNEKRSFLSDDRHYLSPAAVVTTTTASMTSWKHDPAYLVHGRVQHLRRSSPYNASHYHHRSHYHHHHHNPVRYTFLGAIDETDELRELLPEGAKGQRGRKQRFSSDSGHFEIEKYDDDEDGIEDDDDEDCKTNLSSPIESSFTSRSSPSSELDSSSIATSASFHSTREEFNVEDEEEDGDEIFFDTAMNIRRSSSEHLLPKSMSLLKINSSSSSSRSSSPTTPTATITTSMSSHRLSSASWMVSSLKPRHLIGLTLRKARSLLSRHKGSSRNQ